MYRVASRGILAFEPKQGLFTTLGVKLGFGQDYETAAVFDNACRFGGVANTAVPNFVYRFTKHDVVRAIQSYAPIAGHRYRFWYATRLSDRLYRMKKKHLGTLVRLTARLLVLLGRTCPFFANNMAFFVSKPAIPGDLFPWLRLEGDAIVPDVEYLEQLYVRKPRAAPTETGGGPVEDPCEPS
jgi:hypothetical protein